MGHLPQDVRQGEANSAWAGDWGGNLQRKGERDAKHFFLPTKKKVLGTERAAQRGHFHTLQTRGERGRTTRFISGALEPPHIQGTSACTKNGTKNCGKNWITK